MGTAAKKIITFRLLWKDGHIKCLGDIEQHLPLSIIATGIGTNYQRMVKLIREPHLYPMESYIQITDFLGIEWIKLAQMVVEEIIDIKSREKN